jgi:hypothetical protein
MVQNLLFQLILTLFLSDLGQAPLTMETFRDPCAFFFDNHASDLISESIQIYLINLFKIKLTQLPNKINIPLYTSK